MSERDLNEAGSAVYLKLSKNDDKVCKQALLGAKLLGHGDFEYGIHATLLLPQGEADLTCEGVGLYKWTNPFEDNDCRLIYAFDYEYHYLSWTIAETLALAGVKMHVSDLFRVGLGHQPKRPVCTTFTALLLSIGIVNPMPIETLREIHNFYPKGRLWIRNPEDSDNWIAVDTQTFWTTTLPGSEGIY